VTDDLVIQVQQQQARELQRHAAALKQWEGTLPTAHQIAAAQEIQATILAVEQRIEKFHNLRIWGYWHLGRFLGRVKRPPHRPGKTILSESFSFEQMGLRVHVARNAQRVARHDKETVHEYLALPPLARLKLLGSNKSDPTIEGLDRFGGADDHKRFGGRNGGSGGRYLLTPQDRLAELQARYPGHRIIDIFPAKRKPGYDALAIGDWRTLKHYPTEKVVYYVHPPFVRADYDRGQGLNDVVRKCICEAHKGNTPIGLLISVRSTINLLIEALDVLDIKMESWGRTQYEDTETGEPDPSPPLSALFTFNEKEDEPRVFNIKGKKLKLVEVDLLDEENGEWFGRGEIIT
jgi:hypothetical protein